jgi:hypothetical protein
MGDLDPPIPWRIVGGPRRLSHGLVDGIAWTFTLERDGAERELVVVVTRQALRADAHEKLPVEAREAIATDGRSEAARVAQFDDSTSCVVVGRHGYLPPSPQLLRLARR